jgi:hypothetical protein
VCEENKEIKVDVPKELAWIILVIIVFFISISIGLSGGVE